MKTRYTVSNGILFMNPYGKDGPWLPVTTLDERAIEMIEDTIREVAEAKIARKHNRKSIKTELGYSRIGLGNV